MKTANGFTALAAVALGTLLLASPALAKRCRRVCREAILTCVHDARTAAACASFSGPARRDCNRTLRRSVHDCRANGGHILSACAATPDVSTCSPSGAFLDPTDAS